MHLASIFIRPANQSHNLHSTEYSISLDARIASQSKFLVICPKEILKDTILREDYDVNDLNDDMQELLRKMNGTV